MPRPWRLIEPTRSDDGYHVVTPEGRRVQLGIVRTWAEFNRMFVARIVAWAPEDVRQRALEVARTNPWAYGFHVLEDGETER